jgi:hypothetical protein
MENPFTARVTAGSYILKFFEVVLLMLFAGFLATPFLSGIVSNFNWLRDLIMTLFDFLPGMEIPLFYLVLLMLGSPLLALYWHRRERMGTLSPERSHAMVRGMIRWGVALATVLASLLFIVLPQIESSRLLLNDTPAGTMKGNDMFVFVLLRNQGLRWILAGSLLLAGCCLFFKRTILAGLLLVMGTSLVVLILWLSVGRVTYYHSGYVIAVFILIATGYLLLLQWNEIRAGLSGTEKVQPQSFVGTPVRWATMLLFVAAVGYGSQDIIKSAHKGTPLAGKWRVMKLERNGAQVPGGAWISDAEAWTTIYIDANNKLNFCTNPYVYDKQAAFYSSYELDTEKGQISIFNIRNHGGPIQFRVEGLGTNELSWRGKVGKDDVRMVLARDL